MKKIYFAAMIPVFLLICTNTLQAQGTGTKLNQVELIKQFTGNWKGEIGKDTTAFWVIKSNGTGLECNYKYVTKDKTIMEGNQLWGYDNKVDKFILSSPNNAINSDSPVLWFTSKNKSVIIPFSDISNPEKVSSVLETEFKSPDMFIQKAIVNNKIVISYNYYRVKN